MTAMIRFNGVGIVLSIALAGTSVVCPRWPEVCDLVAPPPERTPGYVVMAPGRENEIYKARNDAKCQIINRLHAGELDLFEATAWFVFINREPAGYDDRGWQYLPGNSREEKRCRQVILWARSHLTHSLPRSERDLFIEKLEALLSVRLSERGL